MGRRIGTLLLTVILLLSVLCVSVAANPTMTASDEAIKILKAEEGFSRKPYWDYAQWTVGYGTACPEDRREYYTQHGITEEEAEQLLRAHVARFESELHKFVGKTGVKLTQNQFDALLLFSYNCGSSWSYDKNGGLYNAVVSGATGSALIDAFSRWCNAGGQIKTFLLRRRLCEANIYLNGIYSQKAPVNYGYVLYDACGGVSKPNVQGYDTELTANIIPVPTYDGYRFDGWYTARIGGKKVTKLDASVKNGRLYAHWVDNQGNHLGQDSSGGVKVTVTASDVNLRKGPGTSYNIVGSANKGDQFVITETATGNGYTWGKFESGWICLKYTDYDTASKPTEKPEEKPVEKPETPKSRMGTVKVSDSLRVRTGPSTGYDVVAYLKNGTCVEILEQKMTGSMVWGKISKGWISLSYVVLDPEKEEPAAPEETTPTEPPATKPAEKPESSQQVWTGKVKVNDYLRIRRGPSTSTEVVGYLYPNDKVTITEKKTAGSMTWGKISKGWICMDYVVLDSANSGASTQKKVTGTVKVNDYLRVRQGPGTSYAIAGYLSPNTKVEILEQKTVGGTAWGRISKGWISLDYVVLDKQNTSQSKVVKTVTADCLRVRSAAGTGNTIVGYLYTGAKVEILETKSVGGMLWGRISKGWISMDYVK